MSYTAKDIAAGQASLARVPAGTQKRAAEVVARFPAVKVIWGDGPGEHSTGRALDFMVAGDRALGDKIADYLWANRVRLGVAWVIWYQRIRNPEKAAGAWRAMEDRGSATENHKDHVHVMFTTTAYTPVPAPRPPAPAAPAYPGRQLERGDQGANVRKVQQRLRDRGWTVAVDGSFGPKLEETIRDFQRAKKLRVDGHVGPATWAALWALPVT